MAEVIATIKIMPTDPNVDLKKIEERAIQLINKAGAEFGKSNIEPVGFGLNSLNLIIIADESKGGLDPLEEELRKIEGVNSAEVVDVRRAIG